MDGYQLGKDLQSLLDRVSRIEQHLTRFTSTLGGSSVRGARPEVAVASPIDFASMTVADLDRMLDQAYERERDAPPSIQGDHQDFRLKIGNTPQWEQHGTPTVNSSEVFQILDCSGSIEMGWGPGTEVNGFGEHANTGKVCDQGNTTFLVPFMNRHCALASTPMLDHYVVFNNKETNVDRPHVYFGSSVLTQDQLNAGLVWRTPLNAPMQFNTAFNDDDANNTGSFEVTVRIIRLVDHLKRIRTSARAT